MYEIVIVLLLLVSVAIVALILVQQGKGAGMGASFGAGASNTVFGAAGSGNFLTRSTWILALVFFGICLFIGYLQKQDTNKAGDFTNIDAAPAVETVEAPADVPSLDGDVPTLDAAESGDVPALETVDNAASDVPALEGEEAATPKTLEATAADSEGTPATDEEIKQAVEESNNESDK